MRLPCPHLFQSTRAKTGWRRGGYLSCVSTSLRVTPINRVRGRSVVRVRAFSSTPGIHFRLHRQIGRDARDTRFNFVRCRHRHHPPLSPYQRRGTCFWTRYVYNHSHTTRDHPPRMRRARGTRSLIEITLSLNRPRTSEPCPFSVGRLEFSRKGFGGASPGNLCWRLLVSLHQ